MTENRSFAAWLRPLAGFFALAGVLALSACGGGSGSPINVLGPNSSLTVLPGQVSVYPGTSATLTVSAGLPPYQAFSSNSAVLPVVQQVAGNTIVLSPNPIANSTGSPDVNVAVTINDARNQVVVASVTVKPATLLNAVTITPSGGACGTNLCSGEAGNATVTATLQSGGPAVGRQIRFDVIYGAYGLAATNPSTPLAQTRTVLTDAAGKATVGIQVAANAPTQPAQITATDVAGGQQLTGNFTITNRTATTEITVVPNTATITGAFVNQCSSGFRVDYVVSGGNPPYRVTASAPTAVVIVNPTVFTSGSFFEAITTGICADPLTFTIIDSAGKQTTATLSNTPGTTELPAPIPPPALTITPATIGDASCAGNTFQFVLVGGTAPYNVVTNIPGAIVTPPVIDSSGGTTTVSGLSNSSGLVTVTAVDSTNPKKTASATITCVQTPPSVPPLSITPPSIASSFCTGSTFQFAVSGGTPPYNVVSSTAATGISPATIPASGGTTQITGLQNGSGTTTISVLDAGSPQQKVASTVVCGPTPPPLQVSPASISATTCAADPSTTPPTPAKAFQLVITGGTPPYKVFSSIVGVTITPPTVAASGNATVISTLPPGTTTISIIDSNVPQFTTAATIACAVPAGP